MPTKALDGRTPFEVRYSAKPDLAHLRAFGAPCTVVQLLEKLKRLDARSRMCFFVSHKYEGGGYRVWDLRKGVVVESRNVVFFEDGLPPPTLNESHQQSADADKAVIQPAPDFSVDPPTPPAAHPAPTPPTTPAQPLEPPALQVATPDDAATPSPHPRITIRLPGRLMTQPRTDDDDSDDSGPGGESDGLDGSVHPVHNVSHVPDYPARLLRSGLRRDGGGGGGTALLSSCPPFAFSAGLPGGIQLSQLPDPRNVREAMAAPDADCWKEAMDKEMSNLKSHDVYELVPRTKGMHTLRLG